MTFRRTLVRNSEGRVATLGEMSADEIWDGLPAERRASLAKALGVTPQVVAAAPTSRHAANTTQGRIAIVAHAVATDAKCKGKAREALDMLADDDLQGMTGKAMVKALQMADASDARAEMRSAIQTNGGWMDGRNPTRKSNGSSQDVWARAIELNSPGATLKGA